MGALPANHHLAQRAAVTLDDLSGEPFIALPASAGPLRQFWLAAEERRAPPRIAAEAETAEETFERATPGSTSVRTWCVAPLPACPRASSPSYGAPVMTAEAIQVFTGIFCKCARHRG